MHWGLGIAMLGAIPVLAVLFRTLTTVLPPLAGYAAGLGLYWLLLAVLILRTLDRAEILRLVQPRSPGAALIALAALPVIVVAGSVILGLGSVGLPVYVLPLIALAALLNGTLEELFWRGAILARPDGQPPDREGIGAAWFLFTIWHLALVFARGVVLPGGPLALLGGAAVLGAIWMAMRLRSRTAGAGIAAHVGLNLFAFTELGLANWPQATP